MNRRLPLLIALLAIGAGIWFALSSKRAPAPLEPTLQPYVFANALPAAHPPETALRQETLADPVKRALSRIEWGPPDIFYWTQRHLPADPQMRADLARGLVQRFEQVIVGSPLLGARFLQALGLVGDPAGLPTLEKAARNPPNFLRVAAIHALSGFPLSPELRDLYIALTNDTEEEVRSAALTEFLKRDVLGDEAAIGSFIEASDGGAAVSWLQQVATRKLSGLAEQCARHVKSESRRARQTAILALLVLKDPRGMAAAREELQQQEVLRLTTTLTLFRDARAVPPQEDVRRLSDHPNGEVRRYVAQALGPWCDGADREFAVAILTRLAVDTDPVVQRTAVEMLWKHGRFDGLTAWREQLRTGHANALKEAAQLLCETLKDPAAPPIIRQRLTGEKLDGTDQANLLFGLRFFTDAADVPLFVARIERAGSNDDLHVGDKGWLAEFASLYAQGIGPAATGPVVAALARTTRPRAQLALLDTLRGVLHGAAPADAAAAAEAVLALACDAKAEQGVRIAAIESVPYFDDAALGSRLLGLRAAVGDKRLADAITRIFVCYF